jgi:hypothetical protein
MECANAICHVTARGNEQKVIYRDGSGIHRVVERLTKKEPRTIKRSHVARRPSPTMCQESRVDPCSVQPAQKSLDQDTGLR